MFRNWIKTALVWDGVLPIVMSAVGPFIRLCLPNNDAVVAILTLTVLIGAFGWRFWLGAKHFAATPHFLWQQWLFYLAIFFLIMLEALLIVFGLEPGGIGPGDWQTLYYMYAIYFGMMLLAMCPHWWKHEELVAQASPSGFGD